MLRPRLLIVLFALALALPASPAPAAGEQEQLGLRIARYAKRFVGVPYEYGGMSPRGFDCSCFTAYVYRRFGIRLPHYTVAQYRRGRNIRFRRLRPGDRFEPLAGWYRNRLVGVRRLVRWS